MNVKKKELLKAIETIKDFGGDNNTIIYYLLPELGFDENKEFELEEELKKWTEEHQNDRFYIDSFVGYNELDEFVLLPYRLKQLQNILNSCKKVLEIA